MEHTTIGVVQVKTVIQTGTAEINGYCTQWYQTKLWLKIPKKQLWSRYTLFLYSFSLSYGHYQKQNSDLCQNPLQLLLSRGTFPMTQAGQVLSLPAHSAWPTGVTVSPPWIQCLWLFSVKIFVTKLQGKLFSNSYINTYLGSILLLKYTSEQQSLYTCKKTSIRILDILNHN